VQNQALYGEHGSVFHFGRNSAKAANKYVQHTLRKTIGDEEFEALFDDKLGTHSVRKYASTVCRVQCGKDNTDFRARWKTTRRQHDQYTDVELAWPDGQTVLNCDS
jgi:hypothetical protein